MTTVDIAIAEPGVYDLRAEVYHADPVVGGSLSSTGARKLLRPSCPARFAYDRSNPKPPTRTFNLGHAAHRLALGAGAELVDVDAKDYRTKAAQEARDAAWDAGNIPLLPHERAQVTAMHDALMAHRYASALLAPGLGWSERTLVWVDEATGVWCRAMVDRLRPAAASRALIVDYKTCEAGDLDSLSRSIASYGYHQQDPWYRDGVVAVGLDDAPGFVFVCQEKAPPYLITVMQLDDDAVRIGRARNARAREIYRDCTASGVWPAHTNEPIETVALPRWAVRESEELMA